MTNSTRCVLPKTPNENYLDIARNCSGLVNVASQMAQAWLDDGKRGPKDFEWTPNYKCPYTSDLFDASTFENVKLIWSEFCYQKGAQTLGPVLEPFGFIVYLDKKAYLIFRGTLFDANAEKKDDQPDVQADKDFSKIEYENGGKVSRGFWRVFDGLQKSLGKQLLEVKNKNCELIISGHSLGSTLATLAVPVAVDLGLTVSAYPQASPRVGNAEFVEYYNELKVDTYRLVNTKDAVPKVPVGGYAHVGSAVEFTAEYYRVDESGETKKDFGKMHNPCCSYAYALQQVNTDEPYDPVNPDNTSGECIFPVSDDGLKEEGV